MQIHELPSGTPVDSDLIPFDTGTVNYKTPFSGFDVGENTATFTSADEADPAQFKTVDPVETGPIKTILNRLSMAVSNVRYLWKFIGQTVMGTTANTVTGAIAEHEGDISAINTKFSSFSATRTVQWEYSLTANGNANTNLYTLINGDLPSGSKFLGIAGFTSGNVQVATISARYSDSVYSLQVRNLSSSTQTGTFTVYYLCAKI